MVNTKFTRPVNATPMSNRDTGNTSNANLSARVSPKTPQILYPDDSEVFTQTCGDSMSSLDIMDHVDRRNPVIYFITPTYGRREQVAELTRLSQTLLHISNLVWIIAEDSRNCTSVVSGAIFRIKNRIPHVHLASPMPIGSQSKYFFIESFNNVKA